ncbi:MAG TPA: amino acid permease, partial [Planctomycetota bacterium]|nr:amino acid permease [Planctomycetota bacterium]
MPDGTGHRRELGLLTCVALGLTIIVGGGIYALPPVLASMLGPHAWLAFAAAAIVVAPIALMTAEAAGTTERAGGSYAYAKDAFGAVVAVPIGWISCASTVLALAALSLAIGGMVAGAAHLDVRPQWIATGMVAAFGFVNAVGARPGARVSNVLAAAKCIPLLAFVAIGLAVFDVRSFAGGAERLAEAGASGFATAVYRCFFALAGFEVLGVI